MKHLLTILSGLLVALLFARCADDDNLSGGIDGLPERGIVIRLSTGELDTRTQLTSTGDYHHVEEVWAVLYKLKDGADAETATEADFEYKTHEKLEWNPMTEVEYGEGNPQGKEFLLHTDGTVLTNGTYRVLCIGLDDRSGAVYSLTNGNSSSSSLQGFYGKTLAEALAVIRGNKDCTELKPVGSQTSSLLNDPDNPDNTEDDQPEDLTPGSTISMNGDPATAELFAGWEEFVFEEDNINIVEVVLKRRVAGILCYLTDVPLKVNYDGKEQYVTGIRLCLASPAATSISLCRKEGNPTEIEDFGTLDEIGGTIPFESLEGNKVTTLAYYQLPYEEQNYDITNTKETFQEGGETANYLMGVYMLPVKCTGEEILFVQLMIQDDEPTGNQGLATGLYLPDGVYNFKVGLPGPKFIVKESNSGKKDFDIRPNYIYHIGNKDDDIDEPMSLLGQKITVVPKEWTGETIPVEFPSVPIKPKMELVDKSSGLKYSNSYIFDCIGSKDELILEVYNPVVYTKWSLTTTTEGVYLFQDGKYGTSYIPTEADYAKSVVEIPIALTDYAQYRVDANGRQIPPEDDYRTLTITVEGASDPISFDILQYNALVVKFNNADGNPIYRGFSRYDWGTERDPQIGTITTNGKTYGWGYRTYANCVPSYIFNGGNDDYDGYTNYQNAKRAAKKEWDDSAIHVCADNSYTYVNDAVTGGQLQEKEGGWYLPAYYELDAFLNAAGNAKNSGSEERYEAYNVRICSGNSSDMNHYWSSTPVGGTALWSWAMWLNNAGRSSIDDQYSGGNERNHRDRYYYMRQCCRVVYPQYPIGLRPLPLTQGRIKGYFD